MSTNDTKTMNFECPIDLVAETDVVAQANYPKRTDMLIVATDKLLRFMELQSLLQKGELAEDFIENMIEDIASMDDVEAPPLSPDTPMIEPLPEGEASGIILLERRKRRKKS